MLYVYTRAIGDRIAWKSGRTDGNCQFAQLLIETHRKIVAETVYIRYISGIEGHEVLAHVRDRHCTAVVGIRGRHISQVGSGIK